MIVYLVSGKTGDSTTWPVKWFTTKHEAEEICDELNTMVEIILDNEVYPCAEELKYLDPNAEMCYNGSEYYIEEIDCE